MSAPPEGGPLIAGGRVLIVEDQLIIAMEAEALLLALGAGSCDIAVSVEPALELVDRERYAFALLDINLGGTDTSEPVAARLRALGVPFVVASGYGEASAAQPALQSAPVVTKPYTAAQLQAAIAERLSQQG